MWDVGCGRLGFDSWEMGLKGGGGSLYSLQAGALYM